MSSFHLIQIQNIKGMVCLILNVLIKEREKTSLDYPPNFLTGPFKV